MEQQPNFVIKKIFTKDISFEAPNTPDNFKLTWSPEANVDLNISHQSLEDNTYEVTLTLTITTKTQNKTAFLTEIAQSGIFTIENMPEEQMGHMLQSFCPNILFPYAKETVDSLVNRGGFPQINLSPVNFDALYMQSMSEQANTQQQSQASN